jgi:hypothetical protein
MKHKIDKFLLGVLWLLASVLGAQFWFNSIFGFDILSNAHWRYLGVLQASHTQVKIGFYISLACAAAIFLSIMYLIFRPKFRKIIFSHQPAAISPQPSAEIVIPNPSSIEHIPSAISTPPPRPPRLQVPRISNHVPDAAPVAAQPAAPVPKPAENNEHNEELKEIFQDAGYVVKTPPRIGTFRPNLFALGADENLWIGAYGAEPSDISKAVNKITDLFIETLDEDIMITTHAFTIGKFEDHANNIMEFETLDDLREYMGSNQNRKIPDDEKEDFDAYADYINTVIKYFDKT